MTLSRDGSTLFVSAMFDNRVYRVDARAGFVLGYVVSGVYPHDNKISADGTLLYNTSIGALVGMPRPANAPPLTETPGAQFQITVVDVATMQVRERIRTEEAIRPWDFAPDMKGMFVQLANKHEVAYFDLGSRRITKRLALPVKPGIAVADYDFEAPHHGLSATEDGKTVCISSRASDYAALINGPDLSLITTIPVGDGPGWAEMADGGRLCLITNTRSDDLSIISIAEQKEVARLPIGDGPKHVTIARVPQAVLDAMGGKGPSMAPAVAMYRLAGAPSGGCPSRGGWLVERESGRYVMVDTVTFSYRVEGAAVTRCVAPFEVRVDSGILRRRSGNDTLVFVSEVIQSPLGQVMAGGLQNGDTLVVFTKSPSVAAVGYETRRKYVRVRCC